MLRISCTAGLVLLVMIQAASAELKRLDIQTREPYVAGKQFGERGGYERISGVAHFALDPKAEANRQVVDLPLAPVNKEGPVESWA